MIANFLFSDVFLAAAGSLQILGYLLINQTYLRLTLLCGSAFYVAYYYSVGDAPLWGAIFISAMTMVTILAGLVALSARNARWRLPKEHSDLYPHFQELPPGDFRKLVMAAKRMTLTQETIVTHEGIEPDHLYFVISGSFDVSKGDAHFKVPGPTFVGEVAYLTEGPSSATTTLYAGTQVLAWQRETLRIHSRKSPRFKLALEAVISQDLAKKVSLAVSPDARRIPA